MATQHHMSAGCTTIIPQTRSACSSLLRRLERSSASWEPHTHQHNNSHASTTQDLTAGWSCRRRRATQACPCPTYLLSLSVLPIPLPLVHGCRFLAEGSDSNGHLAVGVESPPRVSRPDVTLRAGEGLVCPLPGALRALVVAPVPVAPGIQAVDGDGPRFYTVHLLPQASNSHSGVPRGGGSGTTLTSSNSLEGRVVSLLPAP